MKPYIISCRTFDLSLHPLFLVTFEIHQYYIIFQLRVPRKREISCSYIFGERRIAPFQQIHETRRVHTRAQLSCNPKDLLAVSTQRAHCSQAARRVNPRRFVILSLEKNEISPEGGCLFQVGGRRDIKRFR